MQYSAFLPLSLQSKFTAFYLYFNFFFFLTDYNLFFNYFVPKSLRDVYFFFFFFWWTATVPSHVFRFRPIREQYVWIHKCMIYIYFFPLTPRGSVLCVSSMNTGRMNTRAYLYVKYITHAFTFVCAWFSTCYSGLTTAVRKWYSPNVDDDVATSIRDLAK